MTPTVPSDRPVRWAVAGTGRMAAAFVRDVQPLDDVAFVAVGSRSQASADRFASEHAIPRAHASYADLVADREIDVLYVATPHPQHHALVRMALEAGVAVLCEKPFTVTLAGAQELVDLARDRGTFLMEAMWTRFVPALVRMRELIAAGAIGTPQGVTATFGAWFPYDPADRTFDVDAAGGTSLDLGVYAASFAQHVLGRPAVVHTSATTYPNGSDATVGTLLRYADGRSATYMSSFQAGQTNRATVWGTEGSIELGPTIYCPDTLVLTRGGEPAVTEHLPPDGFGYRHQAREVNACRREGRTESAIMPLADTLDVQWVLEEMLREMGRKVAEAPLG